MPLKLVAAADDDVIASSRRDNEIIGDEPVSSLDEIEHALRLSDAALTREEQSNAEHISERSVQCRGLGEFCLDDRLDAPVELCRFEGSTKQRYFRRRRRLLT